MADLIPFLREVALLLCGVWLMAEALGKGHRGLPVAASTALTALLMWRAWQIAFLPLTNKYESFLGMSLAVLVVSAVRYHTLRRAGRLLLGLATLGFLSATLYFDASVNYPSPLLYTAWYLTHVPISFAAYAFWLVAAANGLDHLTGSFDAGELRLHQEPNVLDGLMLFSAAMIFGGIWGVVSWGAYFLWDAKVIWSVISWLYFTAFAHLRYWPVVSGRVRAAFGLLGVAVIFITYIGTSFMTGSIHAF